MSIITKNNLTPVQQKDYNRQLLLRAHPQTRFNALAAKGTLATVGRNKGNVVSYRRVERLSLPLTPLVAGQTPSPASVNRTEIIKEVDQYGNFIEHSDTLEELDIEGQILAVDEAADLLGKNAAEVLDALTRNVLVTGTNVTYATGTQRSDVGSSNKLTYALLGKAVALLEGANAPYYMGETNGQYEGVRSKEQCYVAVIHPHVMYDLTFDGRVLDTFTYSDPEKLYHLNLKKLGSVLLLPSSQAPIFAGQGDSGDDVYRTIVMGKEAFGTPNFGQEGSLQMFFESLGSAGAADPLHQRGTAGFKAYHAPVIFNNDFMQAIETGASI